MKRTAAKWFNRTNSTAVSKSGTGPRGQGAWKLGDVRTWGLGGVATQIGLRKFRLVLADVSWEERLRYEPKECGWVSRIQLNNTWFIVNWLPPAIWGLEQCYVSLLLSNVLWWNANKLALWLIVLHS